MQNSTAIVVMISGNGSNLQSIIDYIENRNVNGRIVAVISNNPEAYGLERARNAGIKGLVLDHNSYSSREDYDRALMSVIDQHDAGLVVLAGFMRILTEDFVTHYQGRMLNIHPSLLPKFKGLNTHQRAIDEDETEHGASVHFVTPELDGGPVIVQSKVPVFEEDTAKELASRVQEQERNIYPLVVDWFCQNRLKMENNKAILDGITLNESGYAAD